MSAIENVSPTALLLAGWGFAGSVDEGLLVHAQNVIDMKSKRVGEIVVAIAGCDPEAVNLLISNKPHNVKTLEWFRDQKLRGFTARFDEIMAVQEGRAYITRQILGLSPHKIFSVSKDQRKIEAEIHAHDVIPLDYNGNTVLVFSDLEKLHKFSQMGRGEKASSSLYQDLKALNKNEHFYLVLASSSMMIHYKSVIKEAGGQSASDETIQVITQKMGEENPQMHFIVEMLNEALANEVNDIAIVPDRDSTQSTVFFRRYQKLTRTPMVISGQERDDITRILMARSRANKSGGRLLHPVDGNANFAGKAGQAFLRTSFLNLESSQGESISTSIRVLPRTSKSIEMNDLNIDPGIQEELEYFTRLKYGMFIVCGPTGSGKSTTIGSMLCLHHKMYGDSMKRISVEQPCERMLPGVMHMDVSQHQYNQENSGQGSNFAKALKFILRHDPDVIFVGEVRDVESCTVSVDAANTGHLVLSTTHANDPVLGFRRLASLLPAERHFDLVNVLEGILVQRLVTIVCQSCSEVMPVDEAVRASLHRYCLSKGINLSDYQLPESYRKINPHGNCKHCINGYVNMLPVHGLLKMNPRVRELLLSKNEQDWMKAQAASGSQYGLFDAAFKLFVDGQIDIDSLML